MATAAPVLHRDPRVDAYIAKAAPFARPILAHLRDVIHAACPDVEEGMKWGMPFFMHQGNLCHMAAFKQHCGFGFWRSNELPDLAEAEGAMGNFGRIGSMDDLPPKRKLTGLVKAAAKLNESGPKTRGKSTPKAALDMPPQLEAALAANAGARAHFDAFPPSAQRDYMEWIADAKRDETREARLATAVEWIGEGKTRHWKYKRS